MVSNDDIQKCCDTWIIVSTKYSNCKKKIKLMMTSCGYEIEEKKHIIHDTIKIQDGAEVLKNLSRLFRSRVF